MSSTIRSASVITRRPPSRTGRRLAAAAIALVASIGLAVGIDPFGLIASAPEETVALGLIATEAVVAFLVVYPMVGFVVDLVAAWRGSRPLGSGGSGDGGAAFGVWSTSESGADGWTVSEGWGRHSGGDFGGGGDSGGNGGGGGD